MTEMAARPWWADVQHLRPQQDGGAMSPAPTRTWADDADFTDALATSAVAGSDDGRSAFASAGDDGRSRFASAGAADDFAPADWSSAVALLDLPAMDDVLSAVDNPLPLAFDLDDVDWTPTKRSAAEVLDELDFAPAKRFARAAADLAASRDGRFERAADEMVLAAPTPTGRRTVEITGDADAVATTAPAMAEPAARPYRRQRASAAERIAGRPDRVAMWAVVLGVVLILVAAFSAPGAEAAVLALP